MNPNASKVTKSTSLASNANEAVAADYATKPLHRVSVAPMFPYHVEHLHSHMPLHHPFTVFPAPHWGPHGANQMKPIQESMAGYLSKKRLNEPEDEEEARRENKKKKEKDRRDKLNTKFTRLSELLEIPDESKVDRVGILGDAIALIEKLRKELEQSRAEQNRLQSTNDRLVNYLQFMMPSVALGDSIADQYYSGQSAIQPSPLMAESAPTSITVTSPHGQICLPHATEGLGAAHIAKSPVRPQSEPTHAIGDARHTESAPDPPLSDHLQQYHFSKEIDPDVMLSLMCYFDGKSQPFPHSRLDYEHDGPGDGFDEDTPPLA